MGWETVTVLELTELVGVRGCEWGMEDCQNVRIDITCQGEGMGV